MAAMDLSSLDALHPSFDPTIGLLTLDLDHGKANEVGSAQLDAFTALCDQLEQSGPVRTLCTTSRRTSRRGTPLFIAGANVTERADWDDTRVRAHVRTQRSLMQRIRRLPVFHVVLSHGVTLGWGTEYLLTADYVLATPSASFGLPETGLGIIPGARGSAELAALIGPAHAMRMGCTGEQLDARAANDVGLVQELLEDLDAGLVRVHALATRVATRSPTAVAAFKRALLDAHGRPEADRLEIEALAYEHCVASGEAAIGRAAFAQIRAGERPDWGPLDLAPVKNDA